MTENEIMLMKALSAVQHLIEYIDTEHPFDLDAAVSVLNDPAVTAWIHSNAVLLPARRDGKSLNERLSLSVPTGGGE